MVRHVREARPRRPSARCRSAVSFGDIERVYVWDHRLLRREWVPLSRFTVLVGQNDTGKSTLLDAVEQLLTGRANVGEGSACVGWLPTPGAMQPAPEGAYVFRGHRPPAGGRPLAVEDERVHRYVVYDAECSLVLGETDREVLPRVHCIRLDLGDRTTAHQIVTGYLRDLAFRLLREPPGWEESDLRPFSGRGEAVARWVRDALDELAAGTYKLLPAFIRRRYREVVICIDTSELDDRFTRPLVREEKPVRRGLRLTTSSSSRPVSGRGCWRPCTSSRDACS
ncbi:MAG: hypothetical protein E6J41_26525 [Chloroflexi bacterium]|nr:MAG: hypothetical protein E6J41_26525 [Chloroflexota bacterium]